MEKSLVHVAF